MAKRTPRHTLIPNANNVRFLTRVLEFVAKGVRDPKALAEVLDCEVRTVHYYTQAGDWLGLIETQESRDPHLTRLGLEFVYAGRQRPKVYAEAIWSIWNIGFPTAQSVLDFYLPVEFGPDLAAPDHAGTSWTTSA